MMMSTATSLGNMTPVAGQARLVADIVSGTGNSAPEQFISLGTDIFFVARPDGSNEEIMKLDTLTDLITTPTLLSAAGSGTINQLTVLSGKLFFTYDGDNAVGEELYSFNPATGIVMLVEDIFSGPSGSAPGELTPHNGSLYYRAMVEVGGKDKSELYRVNPDTLLNEQLTDLSADIASDTFGYSPLEITPLAGRLFFQGSDQEDGRGRELFAFDPADDSTSRVADIQPGEESVPRNLAALDGRLYFPADNGTDGENPCVFDSADDSFTQLNDVATGSQHSGPYEFTQLDDRIIFGATNGFGQELYLLDPGTNQVTLADDVAKGFRGSHVGFNLTPGWIEFNGAWYFTANDNSQSGTVLFRLDLPGMTVSQIGVSEPNVVQS
jgi:ELWxxDGT repeat protein